MSVGGGCVCGGGGVHPYSEECTTLFPPQAKNSMSYVCPSCGSTFSDLDVDRLFDPSDGNLRSSFHTAGRKAGGDVLFRFCRCSHCGTVLAEDAPATSTVDARTRISLYVGSLQ